MGEKGNYHRFDGAVWFERQVHMRTRAALDARGSAASSRSREYKTEYTRQSALFQAERAEIKKQRREKFLAREKKKLAAQRKGV